jgi:hypothetical protein
MANSRYQRRKTKEYFIMAFTRKNVAAIDGITPAQVDAIMTLHGTSMADYMPKNDFDAKVKEQVDEALKDTQKKIGDIDIDKLKEQAAKAEKLEQDLAATKMQTNIAMRLMKENAVDVKAVGALLDMSKITYENDALKGLDEQITALKESHKWAFTVPAPAAQGQRQGQGAGAKTEEQTYLDSKYVKNPYYTKKE